MGILTACQTMEGYRGSINRLHLKTEIQWIFTEETTTVEFDNNVIIRIESHILGIE